MLNLRYLTLCNNSLCCCCPDPFHMISNTRYRELSMPFENHINNLLSFGSKFQSYLVLSSVLCCEYSHSLLFICMVVLTALMSMHYMGPCCPGRSENGVRFFITGVTNGYGLPHEYRELNPGPVEELQVLLTTEL